MPNDLKFISPMTDFVFKQLLTDNNNLDILISLLQAILPIPPKDYKGIKIVDPCLYREHETGKQCFLDLRLVTEKEDMINIESQQRSIKGMLDRLCFYSCRMAGNQVIIGEDYTQMRKVYCIAILGFRCKDIDTNKCHNVFHFSNSDPESKRLLSSSIQVHTLETVKLSQLEAGTTLHQWVSFFAAKTFVEIMTFIEKGGIMAKAALHYLKLTESEVAQLLAEAEEKNKLDEKARQAAALDEAREEGLEEGIEEGIKKNREETAIKLLLLNAPLSLITGSTGFSVKKIKSIAAKLKR